jgi:hypothetical protein
MMGKPLTRDQLLYGTHRAIARLEWIDKHVQARPADHATTKRLVRELRDLEAWLEKLLTEFAPPQESETHSDT